MDKNNDEVVDFNEFKALEEKDSGSILNEEEKALTQEFFNKIDKDKNGKLDADGNIISAEIYAKNVTIDARINIGSLFPLNTLSVINGKKNIADAAVFAAVLIYPKRYAPVLTVSLSMMTISEDFLPFQ